MTECISQVEFSFPHSKRIFVSFDDDHLSQDAGLLLLRQLDGVLGLTNRFASKLKEWRDERLLSHSLHDLVRSRVFAIAQGYEDCNDLDKIRTDPLFLACCDRGAGGRALPSQPSMSRFEHQALGAQRKDESPELEREHLTSVREILVEHYIERCKAQKKRPKRLVLDLDSTADETHGQQRFAFYNGFYRHHCYQQLCIFSAEGDLLWIALGSGTESLRKAGLDGIKEITAALRQAFPNIRLDLRADNGFACPELYDWCEDNHVTYFVNCGTAKNLQEKATLLQEWAECLFENQEKEQLTKVFASFSHQARSWRAPRLIIAKAQRTIIGPDLRFIVTNSGLSATKAYEFYSGRGQMENWIKDLKLGLNSGRLSASSFRVNSFRLLLFGLAYQLLHELRRSAAPALRNARIESIRLRLLRLAVRVKLSSRRLWVRFSKDLYSRDDWIATARALGV